MDKFLYIFLDEGGNFDFSQNGTKYFTVTSLTKERPFEAYKDLTELKYDLAELGTCLEYFHAAEDRQAVRNKVFDVIQKNLAGIRIDSVIVEKCKTGPALQDEVEFYPKMIGYLIRYVLTGMGASKYSEVLVFTDAIPVEKKKQAIQKSIKEVLSEMLPKTAKYRIFHHESKSNFDLQIVDYCNWAIYRKHTNGDLRAYEKISKAVVSEFDIFRKGVRKYY
jgi:hypothetical protein